MPCPPKENSNRRAAATGKAQHHKQNRAFLGSGSERIKDEIKRLLEDYIDVWNHCSIPLCLRDTNFLWVLWVGGFVSMADERQSRAFSLNSLTLIFTMEMDWELVHCLYYCFFGCRHWTTTDCGTKFIFEGAACREECVGYASDVILYNCPRDDEHVSFDDRIESTPTVQLLVLDGSMSV